MSKTLILKFNGLLSPDGPNDKGQKCVYILPLTRDQVTSWVVPDQVVPKSAYDREKERADFHLEEFAKLSSFFEKFGDLSNCYDAEDLVRLGQRYLDELKESNENNVQGSATKCPRCEDWSRQGLSDTCPSCDIVSV